MSTEKTTNSDPVDGIVMRLRDYDNCHDGDVDEAADMLEFFFGQMQMHSPDMGGNHSYRFRSGGWPMTHCKGPSEEDAVKSAIQEVKRERDKSAQRDAGEICQHTWPRSGPKAFVCVKCGKHRDELTR